MGDIRLASSKSNLDLRGLAQLQAQADRKQQGALDIFEGLIKGAATKQGDQNSLKANEFINSLNSETAFSDAFNKGLLEESALQKAFGSNLNADVMTNALGQQQQNRDKATSDLNYANGQRDIADLDGIRKFNNDALNFTNRGDVENLFATPGNVAEQYGISQFAADKLKVQQYGRRGELDNEENRLQGLAADKAIGNSFGEDDFANMQYNTSVMASMAERENLPFDSITGKIDYTNVSDTRQAEIENELVNMPGGLKARQTLTGTLDTFRQSEIFQKGSEIEKAQWTAAHTSAYKDRYDLKGQEAINYDKDITEGNRLIELENNFAQQRVQTLREYNPTDPAETERRKNLTMASVISKQKELAPQGSWMDWFNGRTGGTNLGKELTALDGKEVTINGVTRKIEPWMLETAMMTATQTEQESWGNPTTAIAQLESIATSLAFDDNNAIARQRVTDATTDYQKLQVNQGRRQQAVQYAADAKHKKGRGAGSDTIDRVNNNISSPERVGQNAQNDLDAAIKANTKRPASGKTTFSAKKIDPSDSTSGDDTDKVVYDEYTNLKGDAKKAFLADPDNAQKIYAHTRAKVAQGFKDIDFDSAGSTNLQASNTAKRKVEANEPLTAEDEAALKRGDLLAYRAYINNK